MTPAVVQFYHPGQEQFRTGLLVKCGSAWCHVLVFEPLGVHAVRVPAEDETELTYLDHPLTRALPGSKPRPVGQCRTRPSRKSAPTFTRCWS